MMKEMKLTFPAFCSLFIITYIKLIAWISADKEEIGPIETPTTKEWNSRQPLYHLTITKNVLICGRHSDVPTKPYNTMA